MPAVVTVSVARRELAGLPRACGRPTPTNYEAAGTRRRRSGDAACRSASFGSVAAAAPPAACCRPSSRGSATISSRSSCDTTDVKLMPSSGMATVGSSSDDAGCRDVVGQRRAGISRVLPGHRHGVLDRVLELPDVARPAVVHQRAHRFLGQRSRRQVVVAARLLHEMPGQQRDVLARGRAAAAG